MSQIAVRNAEPGDARVIAEMIEEIELYYGSSVIQSFEERLSQVKIALFGSQPLAFCVLAVIDGEAVGLAAYTYLWPAAGSTHSLFLKELYVRPYGRRLGTGTRLVEEMRSIATARPGCSRVEWMTDRDNAEAIAFYKSLGYEEMAGKVNYRVSCPGTEKA